MRKLNWNHFKLYHRSYFGSYNMTMTMLGSGDHDGNAVFSISIARGSLEVWFDVSLIWKELESSRRASFCFMFVYISCLQCNALFIYNAIFVLDFISFDSLYLPHCVCLSVRLNFETNRDKWSHQDRDLLLHLQCINV